MSSTRQMWPLGIPSTGVTFFQPMQAWLHEDADREDVEEGPKGVLKDLKLQGLGSQTVHVTARIPRLLQSTTQQVSDGDTEQLPKALQRGHA